MCVSYKPKNPLYVATEVLSIIKSIKYHRVMASTFLKRSVHGVTCGYVTWHASGMRHRHEHANVCVLVCLDLTASIFGMTIDINVCDSLNANHVHNIILNIQLHHV